MSVYDYPHSEYEHNHVVSMLLHEMRHLKDRLDALEKKEAADYAELTNRIAALELKEQQDYTALKTAIETETQARITAINELTAHMHTDIDTYAKYEASTLGIILNREDKNNGSI